MPADRLPAWMKRRFLGLALIITCLLLCGLTAMDFATRAGRPGGFLVNDYDAFYTAGHLFREGAMANAYDATAMQAAQRRVVGGLNFAPYTYPPHFGLVVAALALMPLVPGYMLWVGASLGTFLLALRRLAGQHWVFVWLALFPAALVGARNGQTGLLIGAFLALFAMDIRNGRARAGLPLALLTIKPHLLPAVGLYLLLTRQWRVLGVAALATLVLLGVASAVMGPAIWGHFAAAIGDAAAFLERGAYPFHRMVSLYAALHAMGMLPAAAFALQLGFGVGCLGLLGLAWRAGWPPPQLLAAAIMASPMLSPYVYDYDLTLLAVALGLLAPDIAARARPWQATLLVASGWWAAGSGLFLASTNAGGSSPSLGIYGVLLFCALALWTARQPEPPAAGNGARGRI